MESLETSYLYKNLIEINKKYDSCTFVDLDFIDLFSLSSPNTKTIDDLNNIKKKITSKYYNLAHKYHPDKHITNTESIIQIKN